MRSYIFTKWEKDLLEQWLESGEEDQSTRDLFSKIRRNLPQLHEDLSLMVLVTKNLRIVGRWHGRLTASSEFGSALQRAKKSYTRFDE